MLNHKTKHQKLSLRRSLACIMLLLWFFMSKVFAQVYYFGVLAPHGSAVTQQYWQPWVDGLNGRLHGDSVVLVALDLNQLSQQLGDNKLDLVLAPQSQFIGIDTSGWRWLATLPTAQFDPNKPFNTDKQPQQTAMSQIGSTIWVKADSPFQDLTDLAQHPIAAVDKRAFGGYLLGLHLFQQQGIDSRNIDFKFVGYPIENTLNALQNGSVQAAITPLCLMEDMQAKGKIDSRRFRALAINQQVDSPCVASSKIFPNWTLAATKKAPTHVVYAMHQYVFEKNANNDSYNNSQHLYWLPTASTQEVEQILMDLDMHPSQKPLTVQLKQWFSSHLWLLVIAGIILLVSIVNYVWMSNLAWRQRQKIIHQHEQLRDYDDLIGKSERLLIVGEMSASIAHEVNQPLTAIQNYAQGALIRLDKDNLDKTSAKFVLDNILSQVQRSASVIHNIRYLNEQPTSSVQTVELLAVIEQCLRLLDNKLAGLQLYFQGDNVQLTLPNLLLDQVLINLLLNAKQQGATQLFVLSQPVKINDLNSIKLSIIDDAGGFTSEQIQQFNHQSSKYTQHLTSTKANGMGIGLSICRRLITSVGGQFEINNVALSPLVTTMNTNSIATTLKYWQTNDNSQSNHAYFEKVQSSICIPQTHTGAKIVLTLPVDNLANEKYKR